MAQRVYDDERSDEDLRRLTGIDAGEERRIEAAAHRGHAADEIRGLEDAYNAPSAKRGGGATTPEELAEREQANGNSPDDDRLGAGFKPESSPTGKPGRKKGKGGLKGFLTPKRAVLSTGVVSFLVIMFLAFSGFSVFELINLRENLLGKGNRFTNSVLQKRRANSLAATLRKLNKGTLDDINKVDFKKKFEAQGFRVTFDANGRLTEFGFNSQSEGYKPFNLNNSNLVAETNAFFGNNTFGREASRGYDTAVSNKGGFWRGEGAARVYRAHGLTFYNWLDRKPSDKAQTMRQKFAENLRDTLSENPTSPEGAKARAQLVSENSTVDSEGRVIPANVVDGAEVMNGSENGGISPTAYRDQMLADPTATDRILGVGASNDVDTMANGTDSALRRGVTSISPTDVATGTLKTAVKSVNAVSYLQTACGVKGFLNFIANARNIMMAIELARFSVKMLNAADDQKAGILTSNAVNMVMIYLHTPDANGKSYFASGGMRWLFGDMSARPSAADSSRYGVGRNNSGALGSIANYVNSIPGMDKCKIINNGAVTVAGFVVGITAAVFSGGTSAAVNAAALVTLGILKEVAVQIATPLLIKAGARMVVNGLDENGRMAGSAMASGFGVLSGMVAGSNGLRPSTDKQIAQMIPQVESEERYAASQMSLYDRYLNPGNGLSLMSRVGMASPRSLTGFAAQLHYGGLSLFRNLTTFSALSYLTPQTALAAGNTTGGCEDPQVMRLGIATDPFCNPIMASAPNLNIEQTEGILRTHDQIDAENQPTDTQQGGQKSFLEYVRLCFSGRPAILYNPDPDQEGSESQTEDACVQTGTPLPGDTVGRYDRFAAYYGYLLDETELKRQISEL